MAKELSELWVSEEEKEYKNSAVQKAENLEKKEEICVVGGWVVVVW